MFEVNEMYQSEGYFPFWTMLYGLGVIFYIRGLSNGAAKADPDGYHREFIVLTIIWIAATYFLGHPP